MAIVAATGVAIAVVISTNSRGRYIVASVPSMIRTYVRIALGAAAPRAEIDAQWRRFRLRGIADAEKGLPETYRNAGSDVERLMRYAGLDPEHALLRWGNFDFTMLLPSKIFEADDNGRSYRLRPCTEAIWLRQISLRSNVLMFFLVPNGPGLPAAIHGTSAIPVAESVQSTNAWGLRGPEPDLDAPLRGLILGDSFMQGLFVGDNDTPPECLRRDLERRMNTKVAILNTGVMGYSPEQYYYSFVEFADRFRPHFVVISIFGNDMGAEISDVVIKGKGDWDEAEYWIDKIKTACRERDLTYLIVPIPYEPALLGRRRVAYYPGMLSNILGENSLSFLDPSDKLLDVHLELVVEGIRNDTRRPGCPLFNGHIGDGHFSALGSRAWAEIVGRRVALLLENDRAASAKKR